MVGAFTLPIEPYTTWIDRMRMFEMITGFGMVRPASRCGGRGLMHTRDVHGVSPGRGDGRRGIHRGHVRRRPRVHTRRRPDRLPGRRRHTSALLRRCTEHTASVADSEDALESGWHHGLPRYIPGATGFAGSRYWFFLTRSSFKRFLIPLHLTTLMYVLTLAVLDPTSHVNLIRVLFVLFFRQLPVAPPAHRVLRVLRQGARARLASCCATPSSSSSTSTGWRHSSASTHGPCSPSVSEKRCAPCHGDWLRKAWRLPSPMPMSIAAAPNSRVGEREIGEARRRPRGPVDRPSARNVEPVAGDERSGSRHSHSATAAGSRPGGERPW